MLMPFFKRHPKLLKFTCLGTISCGVGWLGYQVKITQDVLNNALDTSILSIEDSVEKREEDFLVIGFTKEPEERDLSFDSTWNSLKFSFAKRLIALANNENGYIRKKALRQLAKVKNLDYWQCSLLSHMIDAKTAVGLARTANVDNRLFATPQLKYFTHSHDMIIEVVKDLLVKLNARAEHPCMRYFISKAFPEFPEMDRFADHDYTTIELKKYIQSSQDIIPLCLESILHHASVGNYAKHIAELNGLPVLMEIYNRFKDNITVTATISRIISYLSMHQELLDDLHKSGWIGILAEWVNHDDVRISIPAAKTLANLDYDDELLYLQRLYPLHPTGRTVHQPVADVVFVHGLLGGVFFTWRQRKKNQDPIGVLGKRGKQESLTPDTDPNACGKSNPKKKRPSSDPHFQEFIENLEEHLRYDSLSEDYEIVWEDIPTNTNQMGLGPYSCPGSNYKCIERCDPDCYTSCWPRDWLAEDCANLRIIGVNYETNLSMWMSICPVENQKNLDERSNELIHQLMKIGLGKRPIIWVTHSMGGLMVKNLLHTAYCSENKAVRDLCLKTRGIVFYSTPHVGSSIATFNPASALVLWPSIEVQELQQNSPKLLEIHNNFLETVKNIPIKVLTFVETKPTVVSAMKFKFLVVEPRSGNPGCGEYYEIPLDHLGICKPASRSSFIYQKVLHMIRTITNDSNKD